MKDLTYTEAVEHLVNTARTQGGSGGRVAAAVLISANSGSFQVKVPDLCLLDEMNLNAAFTVIAGRVLTREDSGSQIENGYKVMQEIFDDWKGVLLPKEDS